MSVFKIHDKSDRLFFFGLFAIILTAIFINWNRAIYSDIAWLLHGAQVLLNGGNFFDDFFETNPPFNTVFYMPSIWLQNSTELSLDNASALYLLSISTVISLLILFNVRHFELVRADKHVFYLCSLSFMFFSLIATADQLGQRDILAGLGSMCVVATLMQYSPTTYKEYRANPMVWASLIIGTILAFLKPHWGIFILGYFVYRGIKTKSPLFIFDFDFLLISLLTGLYLYLSIAFYPEWFTKVMPYVLSIYSGSDYFTAFKSISGVCISIAACGITAYFCAKEFKASPLHIRQIKYLIILSALSLIPVYMQNKGFQYHFFISYYFISMSIFLASYAICIGNATKKPRVNRLYYIVTIVLLGFFSYSIYKIVATPIAYKNTALPQKIQEYSTPDDSYFIMGENMGYIFPINLYIDRAYGSRFAAYWFLSGQDFEETSPQQIDSRYYFSGLIAEDLKRFKPKVYALQHIHKHDNNGNISTVNIPELFSINPSFAKEWENYQLVETLEDQRRRLPYADTRDKNGQKFIRYDIYVRKDD